MTTGRVWVQGGSEVEDTLASARGPRQGRRGFVHAVDLATSASWCGAPVDEVFPARPWPPPPDLACPGCRSGDESIWHRGASVSPYPVPIVVDGRALFTAIRSARLTISAEVCEGQGTLRLEGAVDLYAAPQLLRSAGELLGLGGVTGLSLDLSDVDEIDEIGARAVAALTRLDQTVTHEGARPSVAQALADAGRSTPPH